MLVALGGLYYVWSYTPLLKTPKVKPSAPPVVELYTTSWCPHCKRALRWLEQSKIAHHNCDIEKDAACKEAWEKIDGKGFPTVVIGDEVLLTGFDSDWVMERVTVD